MGLGGGRTATTRHLRGALKVAGAVVLDNNFHEVVDLFPATDDALDPEGFFQGNRWFTPEQVVELLAFVAKALPMD